MLSAIKLVITENGKLLDSVSRDTDTQPVQLIKSLEEFQRSANDALTKLIEQHGTGKTGNSLDDADENDDDADENDDDAEDEQVSPRKKRK